MKWITSFRAKLILTVFPVVAAVTTVALVMAERQFSATYRRLFEEQFEEQVKTITDAKKKRFEALSSLLQKMAEQPAVVEAVKKKDLKELGQVLRPQLENLAAERLQSESLLLPRKEDGGRPGGGGLGGGLPGALGGSFKPLRPGEDRGGGGGTAGKGRESRFPPGQAPFIDLMDAKGNSLMPSQQRAPVGLGMLSPTKGVDSEVRRKAGKKLWLGDRKLEDVLEHQEVGYIHVEFSDREGTRTIEQVREVFITPLRDEDKKFVGAFVFGLPLTSVVDSMVNRQTKQSQFGEIMSGVWVEDQLVSNTIPEEKRVELETLLHEGLVKETKKQHEVTVPIDGVRHLVFYRQFNPGSPFPIAAQVNLYPLSAMDEEVGQLRRNVVGVGIVALLAALGAVLHISRTLSGPVKELAAATREVERGNFGVRVPVRHRDEMGMLAASFNEMASGLALQERYRSVLNAVADRTVAQQLIERTGRLGGELRHVTVLFCDIRGFTALTENMPPGELIELLNEHMTAMTNVAYEHGGIVDKFVGDLIMVLFGAPMSTGSDAAHAVQCAQDMLRMRRQMNPTSKHALELGIGLATGNVVAGCMGSDQRLSYTVLGHRVNLASRLCSVAMPGEIVMDDETHQEVRSLIQAEPMPPMQLKGISEPVHPWRTTVG